MRTKTILAVVAGLLFCTLSTLEVPELLKLTDDTSNDYSLAVAQEVVATSAVHDQVPRADSVPVLASPKIRRQPVARLQSRGPEPSVDDFLHSLCILRT